MMITSGIKAQYTMGTTGMMNIPTAEMQQTGTFMIGGNYLPEELNPFKYLELNYRCILLKSDYMAKKPKFNQQDRSLSVRLRPLKEGKYWPAIVIGSNDPFKDKGYNYFASVYGVATKSFMIGEHRLAATAGYYYPSIPCRTAYSAASAILPLFASHCPSWPNMTPTDSM